MRNIARTTAIAFCLLFQGYSVLAAGPKISDMGAGGDNKHNLSSLNSRQTGYKASPTDPRGNQICVFCHTPHHAAQTPLWNRGDSGVAFGHYSSSTLVIRRTAKAQYGEPTGTSRLCLSCHDGVTAGGIALGNVIQGGGTMNGVPIAMLGNDRITAGSPTLFTAQKIKTGHHPVSFVYDADVLLAIQGDAVKSTQNYKLPSLTEVKLDTGRRMQCTTCHDPHQNRSREDQLIPSTQRKIAPFWVYGANNDAIKDHDAVCKDCHNFATPSPWP
jgi:hypothetical protein